MLWSRKELCRTFLFGQVLRLLLMVSCYEQHSKVKRSFFLPRSRISVQWNLTWKRFFFSRFLRSTISTPTSSRVATTTETSTEWLERTTTNIQPTVPRYTHVVVSIATAIIISIASSNGYQFSKVKLVPPKKEPHHHEPFKHHVCNVYNFIPLNEHMDGLIMTGRWMSLIRLAQLKHLKRSDV